jgi:gliding motility-associated-like protein
LNHTKYILFYFLFAFQTLGQQNLILNGDFEEYWECPDDATQIERCKYVYNPCENVSTSDYFNACYTPSANSTPVGIPNNFNPGGYQYPLSGNGMLGFLSVDGNMEFNYREYIQLSLVESLICGKKYSFTAYFNLSNGYKYSVRNICFYFSMEQLDEQEYLYKLFEPQFVDSVTEINDTLNWTKISFEFMADKPYRFVSIGHFKKDGIASYFEVDANAFYQNLDTYLFVDSVSLFESEESEVSFPNVFTPNGDGINDVFQPIENVEYISELNILNRWGNIVTTLKHPFYWDGKTKEGDDVLEGVYYYLAVPNSNCEDKKKQSGMIHLIR